jgi:hypothetical protein
MPFEPTTIEHLGLRLYSTLPPVISEMATNAYDSESPKVEIQVPEGAISPESEVVVRDFGHGMTAAEIQDEFLPIGRNRRGEDSKSRMSKHGKVMVTGRKGLGKLSAFGVANEMIVQSVVDGHSIAIRLDYRDMKEWPKKHGKTAYEPQVIAELTGKTDEPTGTTIRLRQFHRKAPFSDEILRKGLARRLGMIGPKFKVVVNGKEVGPGDRVQRSQCPPKFSWDIKDVPGDGDVGPGEKVTGWIGFLERSSQADRGVDIFATKKAVELGSFFNFASTHAQFARAHLVGEIHADFLDAGEDLAATARNSVVWETAAGQELEAWGQKVLQWAFEQWVALRRQEKETQVIKAAKFDLWLESRPERERKVARRMVQLLVSDDQIDPASTGPLLEIVKSSVETVAFRDLVDAMEEEGTTAATVLRLFEEWRVIEAREHLKISDGRMAAIDQLDKYIETGALEVKEMQPLFEQNLWLLNHSWTEADGQTKYTDLIRKHCKEPKNLPESDRRLDILGVKESSVLTIVELKRPEKTLSRDDLEQIESYVDWARTTLIGTGPDAPKYIHGLLVVGKLSSKADISAKQTRLAGSDIRVETYRDLSNQSSEYYDTVQNALKKIAPEYARRKSKKKS